MEGGPSWLQSCILYHMLTKLMVELQWQPAAVDQWESSQCVWGSAGRRCLKNHVSSSNDVKKDPFRFYPIFYLLDSYEHATSYLSQREKFFHQKALDLSVDLSQDFFAVRQNSWNLFRATCLWTRVLANDVYGFHAWQCECLRSFKIGLSRVWPRTSDTPAALPWTLSHLPCSWLACCRAFPARKPFSWQRFLWPLFGLRLPRRGEHSSPVCLHALPAQQSQQQQQFGPQQIRADRYVKESNRAELNCCSISGYKFLMPSCKSAITHMARSFTDIFLVRKNSLLERLISNSPSYKNVLYSKFN